MTSSVESMNDVKKSFKDKKIFYLLFFVIIPFIILSVTGIILLTRVIINDNDPTKIIPCHVYGYNVTTNFNNNTNYICHDNSYPYKGEFLISEISKKEKWAVKDRCYTTFEEAEQESISLVGKNTTCWNDNFIIYIKGNDYFHPDTDDNFVLLLFLFILTIGFIMMALLGLSEAQKKYMK